MSASYPAKLTSKGQLTLPAAMRAALKLQPGDHLKFVQDANGKFWVEPINATLGDLRGAIGGGKQKFSSKAIAELIAESRRTRGERAIASKAGKRR